ncbi:polysaccharide biosynthesis tyrosine autokinase [Pseudoalteromonas sp. PA2MD11]|uniref:polysaccharide biosynthesis tyrosine autokinase n=1 Tax=Pseudoalteromonas sp. PA2MD11 TaxID=2785057 RepID=UPI001ADF2E2B|nr:polysaccharide biosynthesis tyrosine autokinase [Pseudoalteromonas sp. PA2MD11]
MNAQSNLINDLQKKQSGSQVNEIDLLSLLGALLDKKFFLCFVTAVFFIFGIIIAYFSVPIYKANAILQVEQQRTSLPGFDEINGMFDAPSNASTEIELLSSRAVIGEAVDDLNLTVSAEPKLFPFIGWKYFNSFKSSQKTPYSDAMFNLESYAWGGENINVDLFSVPREFEGVEFYLRLVEHNKFEVSNDNGDVILDGEVGEEASNEEFSILVTEISAAIGTDFVIKKMNRLQTILRLQNELNASEVSRGTGVIGLTVQSSKPSKAVMILDKITEIYVKNNIARNSAEAQQSLEFLNHQLPEVKRQLDNAENRFNKYKVEQESVNITLETEAVLDSLVKIDTKLQELDLKKLEIGRKFTVEHPSYQAINEQISAVRAQRKSLLNEVQVLPETQQKLLSLTRDVQVNSEIYTLLLSKAQELDIVKAGTVGNVRVIDKAIVNTSSPVKPRKPLIIFAMTLLGIILGVTVIFVQRLLNRGVEDPSEIESLGLPVYASVPYSDYQDKLTGFSRGNKGNKPKSILAVDNPADLSIEALRSLRTSLHFAMMEAKNNIIAISGPSPGVGKSFISVNLATVLAQSGKKVLIIDADMRKGYLQTQFGMKWDDGLSDYLSGRLNLEEVTKTSQVQDLDVITRGQIPPNPSELLMHSNFTKLIEQVKDKYDIVIIDTPPILAVTDPAIVSAHTGTTLLVTRFGQNHAREIELTRNRFEQNGIGVKGVVFNGVLRKASNAYGYYGYYNYEYKSGN